MFASESIRTYCALVSNRRTLRRPDMTSVSLVPALQDVPAAMGMVADHRPEAQRWNAVPPMQFQAPSLVQAPELAPVEGPVTGGVPVFTGGLAGAVLVAV